MTANLSRPTVNLNHPSKEIPMNRLIAGGAVRSAIHGDMAAEARAGGRALTKALAHFAGPAMSRDLMAEGIEAGTLDHVWSYYIDPSVRSSLVEGTSEQRQARRDHWRSIARSAAGMGSYPDTLPGNPEKTLVSLTDAQAMLDWPVYRAALMQSTDDCQSRGHLDPLGFVDHPSQDPILEAEVLNRP